MNSKRRNKTGKAKFAKKPILVEKLGNNWLAKALPVGMLLLLLCLVGVFAFQGTGGVISITGLIGSAVFSENTGSLNTSGQFSIHPVGDYSGGTITGFFGNLDESSSTNISAVQVSPANAVYSSSNTISFVFNSVSSDPIDNCSLYFDQVYVGANTTVSSGVDATIVASGIAEGQHNWSVTCFANGANASSSSRSFTVDLTIPSVNFNSATDSSGVLKNINSITVNVSTVDVNFNYSVINLYNNTNDLINSTTNFSSTFQETYTGLSDGLYYFNATSYDLATNRNNTVTRNVTIDTVIPYISFNSGTSASGYQALNWIFVNVSASDSHLDTIRINVYNSTLSLINTTAGLSSPLVVNYTSLADGVYYFNATANDSVGNVNNTITRNITIDTTRPSINFSGGTATNNSVSSANYVYINVSAFDVNEANISFRIYNATGLVNQVVLTQNNRSYNFTGLSDGTYLYNVTITDAVGFTNTTDTRTITLSSASASISYGGGVESDNSYFNRDWIYINVSAFNALETNMTFSLYNSTGAFNISVFVAGTRSVNFTNLPEEMYKYNVTIRDSIGNANSTTTRTLTLDRTIPNILYNANTDGVGVLKNVNTVTVNVSIVDANFNYTTVNLYNNANSLINSSNSSSSTFQIIYTGLADGLYYYNATSYDLALNRNSSVTRNLTIDSTNPFVNLTSQTTQAGYTSQNWIFVNVSASDTNLNVIRINLFNSTLNLINTTSNSTSPLFVNYTILSDGVYYLNVTVNDSAGNVNNTATRNITIDRTLPIISYGGGTNPANATINTTFIYVNVSAFDLNEANITFSLYNLTNGVVNITTLVSGSRNITWTGLGQGTYYYNVTLTDLANNKNSTLTRNVSIVVDTTPPSIQFNTSTTNAGFFAQSFIQANITATDANLQTITINLYNSTNQLINTTNGVSSPLFVSYTGLTEGTYYLNATAIDTANNKNNSATRTITLDTTLPIISYGGGTQNNNTLLLQNFIFINISTYDLNEENITFSLYNSTGAINITTLGVGNRQINFTGLNSVMSYWYNVTTTDKAGNKNTTDTRKIILDTSPVSIAFVTPTTASGSYQTSWIDVNVSASSTGLDVITINLYNSTGSLINTTNSSSSPLYVNFTGLASGTYYLNATANDTRLLSNNTETRTIQFGGTMSVSLQSPLNNSAKGNSSILFAYNVTHSGTINNCSLILNGLINKTNTSIQKDVSQYFQLNNLSSGRYNWSVVCYDSLGFQGTTPTRILDIILLTGFGGITTDLSSVSDLNNITNFTLDIPSLGRITYTQPVNLSGGANVASLVSITPFSAYVNSLSEPRLNKSATIQLNGPTYQFTPIVFKDGQFCSNCIVNSYSSGNFSFNVSGFSNYTISANAQLYIWDDTDLTPKEVNDNIAFYANYSNTTSSQAISTATCNITFGDTGMSSMTFNPVSGYYVYNRVFSSSGSIPYNITCDASADGFEPLFLSDSVIVAPDFYGSRNNGNQFYTRVTANVTQAIPEILDMTCNGGSQVTLSAGTTQRVNCAVIIRDFGGGNTIQTVNATFYHYLNHSGDPDDNNYHYTNTSCARNNTNGYNTTFDCAFDVFYFANNGTWRLNITVTDDFPYIVNGLGNASIGQLFAINVTPIIDFGSMYTGETSASPVEANITNLGNMNINVTVYGYGGQNATTGAGLAMVCNVRNISISNERYSINSLDAWSAMTPISSSSTLIQGLTMPQQQNDFAQIVNSTYWKLFVDPVDNPFGECNGTVIFSAQSS